MQVNRNDTAVVFIEPHNEVLSERGAPWPAVRESVKENKSVENILTKPLRRERRVAGHFIEGAPGRRGKKAVKSPRSRRKGHTR